MGIAESATLVTGLGLNLRPAGADKPSMFFLRMRPRNWAIFMGIGVLGWITYARDDTTTPAPHGFWPNAGLALLGVAAIAVGVGAYIVEWKRDRDADMWATWMHSMQARQTDEAERLAALRIQIASPSERARIFAAMTQSPVKKAHMPQAPPQQDPSGTR